MDTKKILATYKKQGARIETKARVKLSGKPDFSLWYTPGVGLAASHLAKHPKDARLMSVKKNSVAVVSDGSAVLGLGNIGPYGALPVMEGKSLIFKEKANIDAWPIVLDTQDPDEIVRIVKAIAPAWGGINLEDIKAPNCFDIEKRLVEELDIPVMHDDQHGTAIVVLAGLINAAKVVKKELKKLKVVISGAGAAGTAVAKLLIAAGVKDIVLLDRAGTIYAGRPELNVHKKELAALTNPRGVKGDLADAMKGADVFIGVSGKGLLKAHHVASMAPRSIVFAMANPEPEILPDEAKKAGAAVVATGRSDFPNQINNALVFPGIFRGALDKGVKKITEATKLRAARALAALVAKPTAAKIIPDLLDTRVMKAVARAVR
ncbi:MAG: malic enzyme-like NAD(P)-binding protein [Candidatus Paceibacterota bacterium]|jgi:malate dehydrogenase (oxaloacetate-decarboxylating)